MKHIAVRKGFTLVEFILFLGILAILGGTIIGLLISTQDARIRQRGIAEVEQTGASLLHTLTRRVRRAESILNPAQQQSGSILALQMAATSEFPTIFLPTASGQLLLIQSTTADQLLSDELMVENLLFWNTSTANGKSAKISFDLKTILKLPQPEEYSKHFSAAITLYPDDQNEAGGCGSCPAPSCIQGVYSWSYCLNSVCTAAPLQLSCE